MNDLDMNKLMAMLSKMDKKDIEKGLTQVSQMLKNSNKDEVIKNIKNQGK